LVPHCVWHRGLGHGVDRHGDLGSLRYSTLMSPPQVLAALIDGAHAQVT
jgi:hypothetical protein